MDAGMVEVKTATKRQRGAITNLMQLYIHDFSEQWAGRPEGELGEDGRFEAYPFLPLYWREADRIPLIIRCGGQLAGFALVNRVSHVGAAVDRNMAEFFVVRKHRRDGTGTAAARTIFARYPGLWEVAVARANLGALSFWRRAIGACPGVTGLEEIDVADESWDGALFRFRI